MKNFHGGNNTAAGVAEWPKPPNDKAVTAVRFRPQRTVLAIQHDL